MSLATREQKAVVTDFCACRALWFFHAMKERIRIRIKQRKTHGPPKTIEQDISSIEYYTGITGSNHLLGRTQTSSVLWLRHKPAPPDEEQFNAPTAGGHARHNASLLAVSNMSCFMVLGDLWVVCDYCGVWSIGFNLL